MIEVPIFHVNSEDPEAVVYVAQLAVQYRQIFHQDVVIDMYCYRKHGHNEGDEPAYTNPEMYAPHRQEAGGASQNLCRSSSLTAAFSSARARSVDSEAIPDNAG